MKNQTNNNNHHEKQPRKSGKRLRDMANQPATRREMIATANDLLCEISHAEDRLNEKIEHLAQRNRHANAACWFALAASIVAVAFAASAFVDVYKF